MSQSSIKKFKVGQIIKAFYLCVKKDMKITRLGDMYIDLILKDSSGSIRSKIWSHVNYFSDKFNEGEIVAIKGSVINFNNSEELNITFIKTADDSFYNEYGFDNTLIIGTINSSVKDLLKYVNDKIKGLPIEHRKILSKIYRLNITRISSIPIDNDSYQLIGGYLQYTYNLLKLNDKIISQYDRLDNNKIIICILLMNIGYIHYYTDDKTYAISESGYELGSVVLGINLLMRIVFQFKNISKESEIYYQKCILFKKDESDKNINYVKSIVLLDKIAIKK